MTFETLITILTIEDLDAYLWYLTINCDPGHWTAFAILAMILSVSLYFDLYLFTSL